MYWIAVTNVLQRIGNSQSCEGRCPAALKLRAQVEELLEENKKLKEQVELYKVLPLWIVISFSNF